MRRLQAQNTFLGLRQGMFLSCWGLYLLRLLALYLSLTSDQSLIIPTLER